MKPETLKVLLEESEYLGVEAKESPEGITFQSFVDYMIVWGELYRLYAKDPTVSGQKKRDEWEKESGEFKTLRHEDGQFTILREQEHAAAS